MKTNVPLLAIAGLVLAGVTTHEPCTCPRRADLSMVHAAERPLGS